MTLKLSHSRWLALILLLALLLRVANLGGKSFWLDEAYSVSRATPGLEHVDPRHPPLYYTILYHWTDTFGADEATARLPSALFSAASVALLYLLARQLFSRDVALLAAALLALSPLNLWYAQEARMYTTVAFAALLMGLGLAWRQHAGLLLYAAGLALGLYVNYLAFPLWIGLSVIWLVLWWQRGRNAVTLILWLAATTAAWWLYRPWWTHFQTWLEGAILNHWMVGRLQTVLGLDAIATWHFLLALAIAAAALLGAALLVPVILRRPRWRRAITVLTLLGSGAFLILVPIPRLYGLKRVLVTGWPFVILFMAWLVSNLQRWRRPVTRALLGLSLLAALVTLFLVPKDDWRGVTTYLQQHMDADDVLWIEPRWNRIPLEYYGIEERVQTANETDLQALGASRDEIWIVAERFHGQPVPSSSGERWLDENWQLRESQPFYRLEVRRYHR